MEYELSEIKLENELTLDLELDILKIEPKLEEKNIVENGEYIPQNEGLDGYSKVNVNVPIPKLEESQRIEIVENGNYNVTPSGDYDAIKKVEVNVNVPEPKLGTKTITSNGTYKAIDDNLDGYSQVEVATSGVDIWNYFEKSPTNVTVNNHDVKLWLKSVPLIDLSKTTSMYNMFVGCSSLKTIPLLDTSHITNMMRTFADCSRLESISQLDTSNVTDMSSCFNSCSRLKTIPLLNTSKVTTMNSMFQYAQGLETIPQIDMSNVEDVRNMFYLCTRLKSLPKLNWQKVNNIYTTFQQCGHLVDLGGFENLGMAYETTKDANYSFYSLKFQQSYNLTHDSLMNVINNLYDIKTKGCKPQQLVLGSDNLTKLSEEERNIVVSKGWTLS